MKTRFLLAALAATASLAACGAEDPSTSGKPTSQNREAEARKAMLDYAKCMRKNGVDMPDPQFDGGHVMQKGPQKVNPAKMRTAEEACKSIRDKVRPPELSGEEQAEFKAEAIKHSRCMRKQGIDFPDPIFDEDGGAQIRIQKGSGINPESAKFKAAEKACRDSLPGGGSTDNEEG